ncbi:hypothetical protein HOG17_01565 [Candidatus Peregrinibacteria bacterium]|jgi:hypothetical protein|nr:hypothetical protein [Candidatus Peregrinibacteria bacterium]MBT4148421.1 hypothetical protein [Candidatus Peregrinibacteria bacterium]MBT4366480.1 hypothetical protein [Candidatus Peregrinibacteria bacterium]MBT4456069.1 hypothetical protein [Candidatus Peregrinibacteria bacterium]
MNENIEPEIREVDYQESSATKKVLSVVGLVLLLASVSFYAFFLSPVLGDYSDMKASVIEKEEVIDELEGRIDTYKEAETNMNITTDVQRLSLLNSVPVGVEQDTVIEDLIMIAEGNDIKLRSVSFGLSEGFKDNVGALKINASFEGDYVDLMNFLEGIEQNARLFKVTSINVQVNQFDGFDVKRVTFSLSMDAFYQE